MDTLGTVNSDFGALEEAERQLRSMNARSRENPDLRGAEATPAQAERMERWMPELNMPEFRRTCLPELRSYRAHQLQQENRGRSTTKISVKIPEALMRQIHTVAEKNPHLFNDSKEFVDDFCVLGLNIGLYVFRQLMDQENVVGTLSWEAEEVLRSLHRETMRLKDLAIFDGHCKRLLDEAGHLEDSLRLTNVMPRVIEQVMAQADKMIRDAPYLKGQYMDIIEKYFGVQSLKKWRDKCRKREERGSVLADKEGDPMIDFGKRHLSLVTTAGSA